ncbi:hypothetical protein [Neorhizobium sp. SOG26]|uniref:hypothetical protein n=1 Tax=Neorhizobium sp. SOG26 TaxID=2060726 RepID=UPI00123734BF|nr:hypothetical protein [Neorhizobium sp. SOG26]
MRPIIDDAVYLLTLQDDGRYHLEGSHLLADLSGIVPAPGDRVTLAIDEDVTSIFEVISRHFVRHLRLASGDEFSAWVLVAQEVDQLEADELLKAFGTLWKSAPRRPSNLPHMKTATRLKRE